ncbi:MAG TPA: hypothetical protein VMH90_05220, partial [Thermoplasmata archaeon]|nr:hypothetical protein [Thermoplasmata archaeon]
PGFARLNSWVYRAEYAAATITILVLVFGYRGLLLRELPWTDVGWTVFWAIWPDLAAFVPIGAASAGGGSWPRWGPALYNLVHNFLVWGAAFGLASLVMAQIPWPMLAWAGHITADRAAGFYLRAPATP